MNAWSPKSERLLFEFSWELENTKHSTCLAALVWHLIGKASLLLQLKVDWASRLQRVLKVRMAETQDTVVHVQIVGGGQTQKRSFVVIVSLQ